MPAAATWSFRVGDVILVFTESASGRVTVETRDPTTGRATVIVKDGERVAAK